VLAVVLLLPAPASAATRHVSTSGSDSAACTASAPCASFDRAYRVAGPGDVVQVAGGRYGWQEIASDPRKNGSGLRPVLFRPAPGASVTIGDLLSYASNVRYRGFAVALDDGGQPDIRAGHDVSVEHVRATNFYISGSSTRNVAIRGGSYGSWPSCGGGAQISGDASNITVDGVTFHDYQVPSSCPDAHLDCLHVFSVTRMTIRNSRFIRCEHYGVLLNSNGPGVENHLVENNFFGPSGIAGFALRGGTEEDFDTVTVRYNSGGSITPQTTQSSLRNVAWYANVAEDIGSCRPGIEYRHNVAEDGGCGATDREAPVAFADFAAGDLHLVPGSATARAAVDYGVPGNAPALDFDRHSRSRGSAPDAGADELGSSPPRAAPRRAAPRRALMRARVRAGRRLRVRRGGRVSVRLRCVRARPGRARSRCSGYMALRSRFDGRRVRRIARRGFRIRSGRAVTVRLRVSPRARRALRRRGHIRATLRVVVRNPGARPRTTSRRMRLRRVAPPRG
jgi:hypothetical protein